jgi:glycerate kinase
LRVVLAPGSFKETFDAVEVARVFEEALAGRAETVSRPMSDGGDGFLAVVRHYRPDVLAVSARVPDPAGREIAALWGWHPEEGVSFIESSAAIGLRLLEPWARDPLLVTSAGLGRLIRTAARLGSERIVVGLGGSATIDAGLGMARELGFRFEDAAGRPIAGPGDLPQLARILAPAERAEWRATAVLALADVTAPLHGPEGAAHAFGPQKGAGREAVERLAAGLERMEERWRADLGAPADLATRQGAGAAGGLGAALAAFLGAALVSGSEWCAGLAGVTEALAGAGGLVTSEGRFDRGSLRGKTTGHLLSLARAARVPAAVVCAAREPDAEAPGAIVLDAAAIGIPPEEPLAREDLARMARLVLDRWEADQGRDILAPR